MKLIVIGCLLASAYSANLEALAGPQAGPQGQYFERTPNNNLVQIKYIGAGSGGLNNAAFNSQNQRTGNFNQELNNQQFQTTQVSSQNQILNQNNQQNQGLNQFTHVFNQGNQNLNQQNQVAQFAQQNTGFSVNAKPFSFSNNQFANPNLVEVTFDENRRQQFIADQERQSQQIQTQPKQGQDFQNQQRQRQQQAQQQQIERQQQQQQAQQQQQRERQQQAQQQQIERQQQQQRAKQQQRERQQQKERQQQQQQEQQQQREREQQQQQFKNQDQQRLTHISQTQVQYRNPFFVQGTKPIRNPHIHHTGSFPIPFPQPISTPMREIAGHLQRVDSDEILGIFQPFTVPFSASLFEGNVNSQFSCASQGQGFYADTTTNCQQFHVCTRVQGRNTPDLYRFTFQCAEGEYFDQRALTCFRLAGPTSRTCAASPFVYQSREARGLQLFSAFSTTPYSPTTTPPGICYLANNHQFVTGIRRK